MRPDSGNQSQGRQKRLVVDTPKEKIPTSYPFVFQRVRV